MADTITEKRCSRCRQTKPLEQFALGLGKGGRHTYCFPCLRDYTHERRRDPRVRAQDSVQRNAYQDALAELRERHRDEFDELYDAALRQAGLR